MKRKFTNRSAFLLALAPVLLALGGVIGTATPASAQLYGPGLSSLYSYASLSAGDLTAGNPLYRSALSFALARDLSGNFVSTSGSHSFTGLDSDGATQTMTLSGSGSALAEYGRLHTYAQGVVTNQYYNAANSPYYTGDGPGGVTNPNGSPQFLQAIGQTVFSDTLTLSPYSYGIVGIRYHFHLDGSIVDSRHSYAFLSFDDGTDSMNFFTDSSFSNFVDWSTPTWSVLPGSSIPITGNFGAVFIVNTRAGDPEGVTVSGTSDFSNTLTLSGIDLLDSNGNIVNGATYLTASGSHYNITGATYGVSSPSAVPEPGAVALLAGMGVAGIGAFAGRRRRR